MISFASRRIWTALDLAWDDLAIVLESSRMTAWNEPRLITRCMFPSGLVVNHSSASHGESAVYGSLCRRRVKADPSATLETRPPPVTGSNSSRGGSGC